MSEKFPTGAPEQETPKTVRGSTLNEGDFVLADGISRKIISKMPSRTEPGLITLELESKVFITVEEDEQVQVPNS